jgi:hypothetical protein
VLTASLLACGASLPGCIVQDIHEELQGANARLDRVEDTLGKIDTTNERARGRCRSGSRHARDPRHRSTRR